MVVWSKRSCENVSPRRKRIRRLFSFRRPNMRRGLHVLPHLFTLGNAFFGFCSIVCASYGDFIAAAQFILLGALMDALDGRIARFAGVTSDLGMQLDSLCDAISFCMAPAFLMYTWQLHITGGFGFLTSALFLSAGLLRLARFNITSDDQTIYFLGLPTTLAGCFLALLFLRLHGAYISIVGTLLLVMCTIVLAGLMISNVRFPTFKHVNKNFIALGLGIFTATSTVMGFIKVLIILFCVYFFGAIAAYGHKKYTEYSLLKRS